MLNFFLITKKCSDRQPDSGELQDILVELVHKKHEGEREVLQQLLDNLDPDQMQAVANMSRKERQAEIGKISSMSRKERKAEIGQFPSMSGIIYTPNSITTQRLL